MEARKSKELCRAEIPERSAMFRAKKQEPRMSLAKACGACQFSLGPMLPLLGHHLVRLLARHHVAYVIAFLRSIEHGLS